MSEIKLYLKVKFETTEARGLVIIFLNEIEILFTFFCSLLDPLLETFQHEENSVCEILLDVSEDIHVYVHQDNSSNLDDGAF